MIYFDNNKEAYAFVIENPIAIIEDVRWQEFCNDPESWDIIDNEFVDLRDTEEYKAKQAKKERERVDMLSLTAADVERAIYKAVGQDFEDIVEMISTLQFGQEDSALQIDLKALKIELKANNFYRGNPYIDQVGALLGFTSQMLDEFFETNDYTKLIKPAEEQGSEAVEESEVQNEETV